MITLHFYPYNAQIIALSLLLVIGATACTPTDDRQRKPDTFAIPTPTIDETDALRALSEGRAQEAARIYTSLAMHSVIPTQKQDLALKAVEALLDYGRINAALEKLAGIPLANSATTTLTKRHQIAAARAAIARRDARRALELLPVDSLGLPVAQQIEFERVLARAHQVLADPENALLAYIALEQLLRGATAIEMNHRHIWHMLEQLQDIQLAGLTGANHGKTYTGWVALAQIVRNTRRQRDKLKNFLPTWTRRFPQHPASTLALSLTELSPNTIGAGDQVALLLPMSGELSSIAIAIRDGFFAAYYADASDTRPDVRIVDVTAGDGDILAYYARAVARGARAVVGPLDKAALSQLASQPVLKVPVLGLNYLQDDTEQGPDNLFQFGLLPEDEARAVAEFAFDRYHTRAGAIVPDSVWGSRLVSAFQERLTELGGSLLDQQDFASNAHDFSQPIKRLLNLDHSYSRKNTLQSILGRELKFEPYRRQDIDFIFLAAPAELARQLRPQLKFHRSGDLPIYTTSRAFSGVRDVQKDSDMEGLLICDIPWLLSDAIDNSPLYRAVDRHWPQQNSLARLYALGIDTYHLLSSLNALLSDDHSDFSYPGRTGNLTLGANNRIRRNLQWAQFIDGVPVKLNSTSSPKTSTAEPPVFMDGANSAANDG